MRGITWAMFWLIFGTGPMPAFAQPAGGAAPLEGTWLATQAERDGKAADDVVGHRLSFTGNRFRILSADGRLFYEGTYRVDANPKPATIDFRHTQGKLKSKTWKGIYALQGDALMICDNAPDLDRPRPAAFGAARASGYVSITFKRAKP